MSKVKLFAPAVVCFIASTLLTASAQTPTVGSCNVFPADNVWNTPVDQLPVNTNSAAWVGTIGSSSPLHPDFGSDPTNGMPYVTVPGTQTKYPATFQYQSQSDAGPYAIPLNAPIEGGSSSNGDRHAISIDTDNCILYEMWSAYPQASSWTAGSGAIYNLNSDTLRPSGWTSADAAGLPVYPGLVKYDEVQSGSINHALRFTAPQTQAAFIWPARHFASNLTGTQYPPMGARFRLRADFDISGFSPTNQVILKAMKKYGFFLADNGTSWFFQGVTDPRWNDTDLHNLTQLTGSDFEAVDESSLMVNQDSGQAVQAGTPAVTVSPATTTVQAGNQQQFSASVSNTTNQGVTWSVNGVAGGNTTVGTISTGGLYTAPATVPSGAITVQATSTANTAAVGSATVTVTAPAVGAPVLSGMTPSSGTAGMNVTVTLTGSNFQAGATVAVGGSGVSVSSVSVVSATQIQAVLSISSGATAGTYGVAVTTTSGTSSALPFTVTAPTTSSPTASAPVLGSVSPNVVSRGSSDVLTLSGANFAPGASVSIGGGVTVTGVQVVNSSTMTVSVQVSRAVRHGSYQAPVTVTTAAGTSNAVALTIQ